MALTLNAKKAQFQRAVDCIGCAIAPSDARKKRSIPELITEIYNENNREADIQLLREILKPNSHLSTHALSASGYKLLALMAIFHDARCLNSEGSLRLDYTKSVIRGFFSEREDIDFDDSAMRNIRMENDQLVLGRNRIGKLDAHQLTKSSLDEYRRCLVAPTISIESMQLDLLSVKTRDINRPKIKDATIGDAHGRIDYIIGWLAAMGAVEVNDEIMFNLLMKDIKVGRSPKSWRNRMETVISITPQAYNMTLTSLGDVFADRNFNDFGMLCLIDILHIKGLAFEMGFGNHEKKLFEYFLTNEKKKTHEPYVLQSNIVERGCFHSAYTCHQTLEANPALKREYRRMVRESLIPHIFLLKISANQRFVYVHAWFNLAILNALRKLAAVIKFLPKDPCLTEEFRCINRAFQEDGLSNLERFNAWVAKGTAVDAMIETRKANELKETLFAEQTLPEDIDGVVTGHDNGQGELMLCAGRIIQLYKDFMRNYEAAIERQKLDCNGSDDRYMFGLMACALSKLREFLEEDGAPSRQRTIEVAYRACLHEFLKKVVSPKTLIQLDLVINPRPVRSNEELLLHPENDSLSHLSLKALLSTVNNEISIVLGSKKCFVDSVAQTFILDEASIAGPQFANSSVIVAAIEKGISMKGHLESLKEMARNIRDESELPLEFLEKVRSLNGYGYMNGQEYIAKRKYIFDYHNTSV